MDEFNLDNHENTPQEPQSPVTPDGTHEAPFTEGGTGSHYATGHASYTAPGQSSPYGNPNSGAPHHSTPYEAGPYGSCNGPHSAGWQPGYQAPPHKVKKSKKPWGAAKVIAAALVCTIIGSSVSSALVGTFLNHKWEGKTQDLQTQIEQMNSRGSGITVQTTPSSSTTGNADHTGAGSPTAPMTPAQVYAQNVKSVVSVTTEGMMSSGWGITPFTSSGSGFIITEDGYILTNYHVIEGNTSVSVTTADDEEFPAQVVGSDALNDVALLKIEATDLPAVVIGDSDNAAVGDMVAAIGNPLGELESTQTVGYISAKNRTVSTEGAILNMIQTDAAINSGNSGGPLFNAYGQVIGITTAKYSGSSGSGATIEGIGFAIPINTVMKLVDDLMEYGYITGQAYLGIVPKDMNLEIASAYGLPAGPKVMTVVEGSCAETAGIQEGDIIVALGDTEINSSSGLKFALRDYSAGDTATLTVYRAGAEIQLQVTFDERPANTEVTPDSQTETQP